jgi:Predicted methyltransferases
MAAIFGQDRQAVLAREITKTYETFLSGDFAQLQQVLSEDANQLRGEMVVMVHGYSEPLADPERLEPDVETMLRVLLDELPLKQAAAIAAKLSGEKKNKLYKWAVDNKGATEK